MNYQHIENLLIRYRGNSIKIKTITGTTYEGLITDVTNDYVAMKVGDISREGEVVIVLLHAIESVQPQRS
jgi:hypothetical protein